MTRDQALDEFYQLRNDDNCFADEYSEYDFEIWLNEYGIVLTKEVL